MACVRVCPAAAIAVEGQQVRIVDEVCTRCGLCLPACPHDAIVAEGDLTRALELAIAGGAALILSVQSAAYFYPATPEQLVNACYAAGFRTVNRGVLGDELVAKEYLALWADKGWGTMIRSTCPVVVKTVKARYPELIPYLAPVATPVAAEARYLKRLYGPDTPVVYAGVCLTESGGDLDAVITYQELKVLLERRGVKPDEQAPYFTRLPEERRRHLSAAGGLPLEMLKEETQASRRFRKVRGLAALEAIARAVAVDRIDLGFVDILSCEGCLDHPLLGPREELFWRRQIVLSTEPPRAREPVVDLAHFKQVNDQFGHEAGNEVLRLAAQDCSAHIRSTDLAARYGGDEFVLVLVRTGMDGALGVADKVRSSVEAMGERLGYAKGLVTASVGVAEFVPGRGPETEDVLVAADRALYRAKASGRNQVATGER